MELQTLCCALPSQPLHFSKHRVSNKFHFIHCDSSLLIWNSIHFHTNFFSSSFAVTSNWNSSSIQISETEFWVWKIIKMYDFCFWVSIKITTIQQIVINFLFWFQHSNRWLKNLHFWDWKNFKGLLHLHMLLIPM